RESQRSLCRRGGARGGTPWPRERRDEALLPPPLHPGRPCTDRGRRLVLVVLIVVLGHAELGRLLIPMADAALLAALAALATAEAVDRAVEAAPVDVRLALLLLELGLLEALVAVVLVVDSGGLVELGCSCLGRVKVVGVLGRGMLRFAGAAPFLEAALREAQLPTVVPALRDAALVPALADAIEASISTSVPAIKAADQTALAKASGRPSLERCSAVGSAVLLVLEAVRGDGVGDGRVDGREGTEDEGELGADLHGGRSERERCCLDGEVE
ncbi:hypothetical protein V8E36_009574, partial [Tilletia maclaganii]